MSSREHKARRKASTVTLVVVSLYAFVTFVFSPALFVTQSPRRIHTCCPPRRQHGRSEGHGGYDAHNSAESEWIPVRYPVKLAAQKARQQQRCRQGYGNADPRQPHHFPQDHLHDCALTRAQRHADSNLAGSLLGRKREHAIESDRSQERSQHAKAYGEKGNDAFCVNRVLDLPVERLD